MDESTGQFWIEGKNLGETVETIQRWARHQFPDQTPERVMLHLAEEQMELLEAFSEWTPGAEPLLAGEIADQIMLLSVLADLVGLDLLTTLQDKHRLNLKSETKFHPELGYDKMVRP